MGSKQEIAEKLFEFIAPGEIFIDAFGGGGSMSLVAQNREYNKVIYNDTPIISKFFETSIHRTEPFRKWVSREEYERNKYKDAYAGLIYGFKNNRNNSYLYSRDFEVFAKAAHDVLVEGDWELWELLGLFRIEHPTSTMLEKKISEACGGKTFKLWHYGYLKRLNAVPLNNGKISVYSMDYRSLPVGVPGSVLYLDPPYENTRKYDINGFDSNELYEWITQLKIPVYLSEYKELRLKNFREIYRIEKRSLFSGKSQIKTERLYWNQL